MKGFLGLGKNLKNLQNNIHFELCGCQSEVLVLNYDREIDMLDVAIYEHNSSFRNKMTWHQKLRYIYRVIRYGTPYHDQIILDSNSVNNLITFLKEIKK